MEENLSKECGKYISLNVSDSEESDRSDDVARRDDAPNDDVDRMGATSEDKDDDVDMEDNDPDTAVVLQGESTRKYYTTAEEVYGTDVETLAMDGDA
jgi:116 kDa U5 small nuclear ribonucleoprotein component